MPSPSCHAATIRRLIETAAGSAVGLILLFAAVGASEATEQLGSVDPHYTEAGFFDIHLCHWPDRAPFFKVLFSTFETEGVKGVSVSYPDGAPMISLSLEHYIEFTRNGRRKRVFLEELDAPSPVPDGWYKAEIRLNGGRTFRASDRIDTHDGLLPIAKRPEPADNAEAVPLPVELSWAPVLGASHYQVTVRDLWTRDLVYRSDITTATSIRVPDGKLAPGGWYQWLVHARDVNEDPELGDFNLGSQTDYFSFAVE